jgi:prepilin-type N-terminal cleavage/methylation domain-containing protein
MKSRTYQKRRGFTLIEMLIVVSIMSLLAAMIFPITKAVNRNKLRNRARAELTQIETAIQRYKDKLGFYPPSTTNSILNSLYYELVGTTAVAGRAGAIGSFETLDGGDRIELAEVRSSFGVDGFSNTSRGAGDEGAQALNFLKGLTPGQVGNYTNRNNAVVRVLVGPAPWPDTKVGALVPNNGSLNPWRYNSLQPTNNPSSFDLWIDVVIDGKTNRINNWSREPLINPRR